MDTSEEPQPSEVSTTGPEPWWHGENGFVDAPWWFRYLVAAAVFGLTSYLAGIQKSEFKEWVFLIGGGLYSAALARELVGLGLLAGAGWWVLSSIEEMPVNRVIILGASIIAFAIAFRPR